MTNLIILHSITLGVLFLGLCQHVLSYLLTLEAFVLITILYLANMISSQRGGIIVTLVILVYSTSTAALGLTLLTNLCRSHGKDLLIHFRLTW